jgi:hypothetical protein
MNREQRERRPSAHVIEDCSVDAAAPWTLCSCGVVVTVEDVEDLNRAYQDHRQAVGLKRRGLGIA